MSKRTASETVTVRLYPGQADKVRAATGQNFSTVVRWLCDNIIAKYAGQDIHRRNEGAAEVAEMVAGTDDFRSPKE